MENRDLQAFLLTFDKDVEVKVWIQIDGEELSEPNMATFTMDEIFEWQDKLDELSLSDDNFLDIFNFADDLLDTLESRLQLAPDFIEELRRIEEDSCPDDWVPVNLPGFNFLECVEDFHTARTMRDLNDAKYHIILAVKDRLGNLKVDIRNDVLFIQQQHNISCSTSIISDLLSIDAKKINDNQWEEGIWSIDLKEI